MAEGIRDAASVVLVRERDGKHEFYWVRRSREVSLGGGFYAFPGGRLDSADASLAQSFDTEPLRITAIRELFEETGVLLAQTKADREKRDEARRALLEERDSFAAVLSNLDAKITPKALHEAGRWLTPPFMKVRFDTRFFVAQVPAGQSAEVWPGELVNGEWVTPEEAIERWTRGRALLHPPARHIAECLKNEPFPQCLAAMRSPPHVTDFVAERIEFQAGIFILPVRTPTIPPATHTNCYVVGERELVVIDPASVYEEEQERLAAFCRGLLAEGRKFKEILLTHEHHDHVGGVEALQRELGIPVRAHRITAEQLEGRLKVDGFIEGDERIRLPGPLALTLRAIFTPGHTRGHLCFLEENSGALITGDMVAGIGTIIVDPPDGDMADYVASLSRLRSLPVNAIYPAHGPVIPDGPRKLDEYLAHRKEREMQVIRALEETGGGTPIALVPHVYRDVPEHTYPLAARSMLAVLEKLVKEQRVVRDGEHFRLA